jgi:uncharacterized protein (TIGR03083 family)
VPLSIAAYVGQYAAASAEIAEREVQAARGRSSQDIRALFDTERARARRGIDLLEGADPVIAGRRGPIRASALLRTRVNELVVHALDAGAALDRQALRVAVRMLAEVLAERHPGKAVEVRVPPYAAVQCVEGPRHTRGTPPNVVETDPATWVLIAAGRMPYSDAVAQGLVKASGLRADLGPYLPLF